MNIAVSDMVRKYGLILALLLGVVILSIISDAFLTFNNLMNVLRQVSINGILAVGMTLVILTAGIRRAVRERTGTRAHRSADPR
jgi:ribose/xylose/arabinose/galactoside ABC-type transport system permease subunit